MRLSESSVPNQESPARLQRSATESESRIQETILLAEPTVEYRRSSVHGDLLDVASDVDWDAQRRAWSRGHLIHNGIT
jgi:hypothetical protein